MKKLLALSLLLLSGTLFADQIECPASLTCWRLGTTFACQNIPDGWQVQDASGAPDTTQPYTVGMTYFDRHSTNFNNVQCNYSSVGGGDFMLERTTTTPIYYPITDGVYLGWAWTAPDKSTATCNGFEYACALSFALPRK